MGACSSGVAGISPRSVEGRKFPELMVCGAMEAKKIHGYQALGGERIGRLCVLFFPSLIFVVSLKL
jgi:hypothetical protein